MKPDHIYI
jgi:hypothetical protein